MAVTITGTGINFPNGTLEGVYTGTSAGNTSWPLGTTISSNCDGCAPPNIAASIAVWTGGSNFFSYYNRGGWSQLAGTWRSRGIVGSSSQLILQRVA